MEIAMLVMGGVSKLISIGIEAAQASAADREAVKRKLLEAITELKVQVESLTEALATDDKAADKALADKFGENH